MVIKFTILVIITVVAAVPIELDSQQNYQTDEIAPVAVKQIVDLTSLSQSQISDNAEYQFKYIVNDEHTGDVKTQEETRKGDHVEGRYTLIDADGYQRIVEYTADDHNGFQAVVHREPIEGYKDHIVRAQQYKIIDKVIGTDSKQTVAIDSYRNQPEYTNTEANEYYYKH